MSLTVTLSRIEKMLNAFIYVSRKAVRAKDTSDRYVKVITDGLAEERDEALEAAAHLVEAYPTYPQHNARLAAESQRDRAVEALSLLRAAAGGLLHLIGPSPVGVGASAAGTYNERVNALTALLKDDPRP